MKIPNNGEGTLLPDAQRVKKENNPACTILRDVAPDREAVTFYDETKHPQRVVDVDSATMGVVRLTAAALNRTPQEIIILAVKRSEGRLH